ncbi:MAG TPA: RNA 2',3'-cyclic phosphodiesterase [Syntrophus sp. (in: bacteria)]|nr:RNA 2',3'-cyclic phosphodiesterase [Syntrophus sp. (in: bacteria)]
MSVITDEKKIRAFLALDPPEEVLGEIASIQNRLRKLIHGDIRWVRPEGIHSTLKFFGELSGDGVANIAAVVEKAAEKEAPFSLSIGGAGVFPDPHRPRVLWLGMGGDVERLRVFQTGIEQALLRIGFPREERPYRPHLTLGRIRSSKGLVGLSRALEKGAEYTAGRFIASGLGLIQSELTPGGAIYTRLKWFPFSGK